jgi:hypothetical protein
LSLGKRITNYRRDRRTGPRRRACRPAAK